MDLVDVWSQLLTLYQAFINNIFRRFECQSCQWFCLTLTSKIWKTDVHKPNLLRPLVRKKTLCQGEKKKSLSKWGFLGGSVIKNPPANVGDGFNLWVRKTPWRRKWQSIPVFLLGKSHGQRGLAGPWGCKSQTWLSK